MAFEYNVPVITPGFNGGQEFAINSLEPIQFSQIFSGTPQLYAGSSFTVEEVVEIGTLINIPEVIDVDFRWYPPKLYLGTWTIFDQVSAFGTYPEDRGFIEDTITKIRRYSTYVVQANANVPIAFHEQSAIDGCNFQLISVEVGVPPFQVQGSQLFEPIAAFKSMNTLSRVPLADKPFNARIKTIGLHIDAGAELTFINYKARIINGISVDLPEFPLTTCIYAPFQTCVEVFAAFIAAAPLQKFTSLAAANAQFAIDGGGLEVASEVVQLVFICPTDPLQTFPYWTFQAIVNL